MREDLETDFDIILSKIDEITKTELTFDKIQVAD